MRTTLLLAGLLLATLASGCFGGQGDGRDHQADGKLPLVGDPSSVAPPGCGTPVFGGVRGREVDVTVDPRNRSRVAAVAMLTPPSMQDLPSPDDLAVWNALARSSDGGLTWQWAFLPYWPGDPAGVSPVFAGGVAFGDPIVQFAPDGDLYMSGIILTGLMQYNMVSLRFPGDSLQAEQVTVFSRGAYGSQQTNMVPGFNPVAYNDKNDMVVDPDSGGWYISWMWRSNAKGGGIATVPVVVYSEDGGTTWQGPVMLFDSPLAGLTADDANLAPAPLILGDKVIVVWTKVGDHGLWAASAPRGTLDFGAPYRIGDLGTGGGEGNNVLTLPMANVASGPGPGGIGQRAYATVIHSGDGYDVGVWWSDDGVTWQGPSTPHAATANAQALPTVAVAPDGRVAAQFVDFSQDPANTHFHVTMSVSGDGGLTWTEHRLTAEPTDTTNAGDRVQAHVGDYFGAAFTSAGLLGAWQDGRDGTADDKFSEIYSCVLREA